MAGEDNNPPAEEEAIRSDVSAELSRLQEAAQFQPPGSMDTSEGIFDPATSYGIGPQVPALSSALEGDEEQSVPVGTRRADSVMRISRTLEDLYNQYPRVGDGSYFLRIERKKPTSWGGMQISGFLCDLNLQISMNEFRERFGGGSYQVQVMGPKGSGLDDQGINAVRSYESIKIEIPGQPKIGESTTDGDSMLRGYVPVPGMGGGLSDQVQMKRMDLEHQEKAHLQQEKDVLLRQLLANQGIDPSVVGTIKEVAERRADEIRVANSERIAELTRQLQKREEIADEKEREIRKLQEEIVNVKTETSQRLRDEESRQVRELRERYESEFSRMKDEHARVIQEIQRSHQVLVADMTSRHTDERRDVEKAGERERERLREDARNRESQLLSDFTRQLEAMKLSYEGRLNDMERAHKREVDAVRDQRDRELESIRTAESTKSVVAEQSANLKVTLFEGELKRARSELESVKQEAADLRNRMFKDPVTAINEASQLMEIVGGGRGGGEEGEGDWKKGIFQVLRGAVEKIPEAAQAIQGARMQNQQAAAMAAAQHAHQARIAAHGQAVPPQMGYQPMPQELPAPQPRPQQPRTARIPVPSWGRAQGAPPAPGSPMGIPPAMQGPIPVEPETPRASYIGNTAPKAPTPPPVTGRQDHVEITKPMGFGSEPVPQQVAPPQPQEQMPVDPSQVQSMNVGGVEITPGMIDEFEKQLNDAIEGGIIPAKMFAEGFVSKVGPEAAKFVINAVNPNDIADSVAASGKNGAMGTREGRKYLNDLWMEVSKLVGA